VRRGQGRPPVDPEIYWEAAEDFDEVLDDEIVDEVGGLLEQFDGEETCKRLFWETLSFDRVRQPLRTSSLARSVAEKIESLEIFATSADLAVVLAKAGTEVEHYHLERLCRTLMRRLPLCLVLLHDQTGDAWTLIYPDTTKKAFLRILPLPGKVSWRLGTAQALAAMETADPQTGSPTPWLFVAERLERFFPGGTPGRRDDLKHIAAYVRDISRFPLLTAAQEKGAGSEPGEEAPDGSGMAYHRWRLVVHNLRYVVYRALQMPRLGMQVEDLVQEGSLGLIRAAELYDPRRGTRFLTYAHYWIKQKMLSALSEQCNLIRWPPHKAPVLLRAHRRGDGRGLRAGERPVRLMGVRKIITQADREAQDHDDYDSPEAQEIAEAIHAVLNGLTYREREIIRLRYGIGGDYAFTLEEVGRIFRVTRERVRQIEQSALERLRHPSHKGRLHGLMRGRGARKASKAKRRDKGKTPRRSHRGR